MGVLRVKVNGQWIDVGTSADGVFKFATVAARDAAYPAATAGDGAYCDTADTDTLWRSNGTAWVAVWGGSVPRIGWYGARLAAQTISSASMAAMLFDTEYADSGNCLTPPSNVFTAPLTGIYSCCAGAAMATSALGVEKGLQIIAAGFTYQQAGFNATGTLTIGITVPLAAGQTAAFSVWHTNGANVNMNSASMSCTRVSP